MTEIHRKGLMRVIGDAGASISVAPVPSDTGVSIGWCPSSVPKAIVPDRLRMPNCTFWVTWSTDREILGIYDQGS